MIKQYGIIVFFGLIATGKSTLARAWASRNNMAYYNSDRIRKELVPISGESSKNEQFNKGIYGPGFSEMTYRALLDRAEIELVHGGSVVLDGSYQARKERDRIRELSNRMGVKVLFVLCTCLEQEMKRRMEIRAKDPNAVSDGRWEIYLKQKARFEDPVELTSDELIVFSTDAPPEDLLNQLEKQL
ncbi:MAG: AAA family ATPase [Thermodesulfobacteriota bacterium]|nr:AAA family ATPase [Thermodesulfobacteriota bacterium]